MKNTKTVALALALLSSAGTSSVMAQSIPDYNPSWYVAPSLNAMDPDRRFGVDKTGYGAGLRFGKPISQDWDVQLGGSYASARSNGNRYEQTLLGADALYMFSRQAFRPFVLIGGGAEHDKYDGADGTSRSKISPYINAGLGFQYGLTDQLAFQADVRRVHGFLRKGFSGFDRGNNTYVNVGLLYAFDKMAAPVRTITPLPEPVAAPAPAIVQPQVAPAAPVYVPPAEVPPSRPRKQDRY